MSSNTLPNNEKTHPKERHIPGVLSRGSTKTMQAREQRASPPLPPPSQATSQVKRLAKSSSKTRSCHERDFTATNQPSPVNRSTTTSV